MVSFGFSAKFFVINYLPVFRLGRKTFVVGKMLFKSFPQDSNL